MTANGLAMRSAGFRSTTLSTYTDVYFIFIFSILLLNPALRMSLCWGYVLSSSNLFVSVGKDILIDKFWSCCGLFERLGNVYGFRV